jgi:hypothetical protein
MNLNHPRVRVAVKLCPARPEEYEGRLATGKHFYFRLRWGVACLGLGDSLDQAVANSGTCMRSVGGPHDGEWISEDLRDQVFADMLDACVL